MISMIGMFLIANPNTANSSNCSQQAAINGAQEQQSVSSQGSCYSLLDILVSHSRK
ncbi:MAG TPA: hypothetical protein VEL70_07300 [Candidatus Acidoferrum sp.]|nr:hypothetical protein [Candidatus Acidoferrum sp.]